MAQNLMYLRSSQADSEKNIRAAENELSIAKRNCDKAKCDIVCTERELWSIEGKKGKVQQRLTELQADLEGILQERFHCMEEKRNIPIELREIQLQINWENDEATTAKRRLDYAQKVNTQVHANADKFNRLLSGLHTLRLSLTEDDIADAMEISYDVMQELRNFIKECPDGVYSSTREEEAHTFLEIIAIADDNAYAFVRDAGIETSGPSFDDFAKSYGVLPSLNNVEPHSDIVRRCAKIMKEFGFSQRRLERNIERKQISSHIDLAPTVVDTFVHFTDNDEDAKRKYETGLASIKKEVYFDRVLVHRCRLRRNDKHKILHEEKSQSIQTMPVVSRREMLKLRLLSVELLENEYGEELEESIERMTTEEIESRLQTAVRCTKETMNRCIQEKMVKRRRGCYCSEQKTELEMAQERLAEIQEESDRAARELRLRVLAAEAPTEEERGIAKAEGLVLEQERRAKCRDIKEKIKHQIGLYGDEEDIEESKEERRREVIYIAYGFSFF
jgi:hypothetical protein